MKTITFVGLIELRRLIRAILALLTVAFSAFATSAAANISEPFDRADAAVVGNGWIEKTPASFSLQAGTLAKVAAGGGYLNNLVYRPSSEDVLDVEASVELRLLAANPGYPQIHVRVQSATASVSNWLDSYVLYVDDDNSGAVLGRQRGSGFVSTLADIPIVPALNATDTYRLRLRATGTAPVQLNAYIERLSGATWTIIGQAAVQDAAPNRLMSAGSVGVSGYLELSYRYDNFVRTNLATSPPVPPAPTPPQLVSIAPLSTTIGSSTAMVTVTGSGFTSSSVGRWNGQARPTTYVSPTQLRLTLPASDLTADAIGAITVVDNALISAPLSFFVLPSNDTVFFDGFNREASPTVGNGWVEKFPAPFEILPSGILWADNTDPYVYHDAIVYRPFSEASLDVETGVEFTRAAGARFPQVHARVQANSIGQATTLESYILFLEEFYSPPQLTIAVQPPITGVYECYIRMVELPSAPEVGVRYRLRLQARGSNPVQLVGIMERFNGGSWELFASGAVTHDANTTGVAFCPFPSVPNPISNPGTVGVAKWLDRVDGYDNFYWRQFSASTVPQVTAVSPSTVTAGAGAFELAVTGLNFTAASVVRWNGTDRPTSYVSATRLVATIAATDVAAAGTANITVFNPGTGASPQSGSVTITGPVSPQFSDTFTRPDALALGNGWLEKSGASFDLVEGRARKRAVWSGYLDNVAYRPATESVLDSEVSAELRLFSPSVGYPQIFARLQPATIGQFGQLDGYILYFNDSPSQLILGRQRGTAFVASLATITLTTPLNTTDTFRMRLRATGMSPVQLQAVIERLQNETWTVIGQATATDGSGARIVTPGVAGFGGYIEGTYAFDNFVVTPLNN